MSNAGTSVDSGESIFKFSGDEYEDALSSDELEDKEVGGGRGDIDCEMFAQMQEMLDSVQQYHASNNHDAPIVQGTQAALQKTRKPKKALMWTDDDGSQRPILPRQPTGTTFMLHILIQRMHRFKEGFVSASACLMISSRSLMKSLKVIRVVWIAKVVLANS